MIKRKHFIRSALAVVLLLTMSAAVSAQGSLPGTGWFTTATFQNVGSATGTVSLQVLPQEGVSGAGSTASFTLDSGANKVFFPGQNNANGTVDVLPALAGNFAGAMVVSSDQQVVAIGQVGNNPIGGLGVTGGNASAMYNGGDATATSLSYPLVKAKFGAKQTYFSIQAGGSAVTYTATIVDNAGGTHTKTGSISPGRSTFLDPTSGFDPVMASTGCGTDPNTSPCVGSLTVVATGGPIVGAVVETQTSVSPQQVAQSTSLLAPSSAADTIFCPVAKFNHSATKRNTGITVANTGTTATQVQLTLTLAAGPDPVGTTYQSTLSINPGASQTFLGTLAGTGNFGTAKPGSLFAATLKTVPAGGSIVAIVNESNAGGVGALKATTYSCFNAAQATGKVAGPLVKEDLGNVAATGVTIQNVGSAATTVSVLYNCGTKGNVTLNTGSLAPGASKTFFRTSKVPDTGSVPSGANCAVTATSTTPTTDKIVGLFAESSDAFGLLLDTKNYEGFNLQ